MKKINQLAWFLLAALSLLVGTWVLVAEGPAHSKFYVFYLFSFCCAIWLFLKRKSLQKTQSQKKGGNL